MLPLFLDKNEHIAIPRAARCSKQILKHVQLTYELKVTCAIHQLQPHKNLRVPENQNPNYIHLNRTGKLVTALQ